MIDFVVSTIKGSGEFPVDMLRYDRATALTGLDSQTIEESCGVYSKDIWTVRVTSSRPATSLRYASFGCRVVSETRYMKNGKVEVYDDAKLLEMYDSMRGTA
jgi:hypothetical protein